jgi:mono/diheme cytochrome c family protein
LLALACADESTAPGGTRVDTILALTGDAAAGETAFPSACGLGGGCHNADGTGTAMAADLTLETADVTDEFIVSAMVNGYESMISQKHLDDQKMADILAYMRREWGG